MPSRRSFLAAAAGGAASIWIDPSRAEAIAGGAPPCDRGTGGHRPRRGFLAPGQDRLHPSNRNIINLNNGGVSPAPGFVHEAMKRHLDFANSTPPPESLWHVLEPRKESVRAALAAEWGVDAEEIALTRNASESLQICQFAST